jgi:hypothetical protein
MIAVRFGTTAIVVPECDPMQPTHRPTPTRSARQDGGATSEEPASREPVDGHALVAQLGREVAAALSAALERVNSLATSGNISRKSLRALRNELELARRVGIMGQQVNRLTRGQLRQSAERIDLTGELRETLIQHRREMESRGIEIHQSLGPAQVMADPTLMFTLLQTLIDWSFEHARSAIDFRIDLTHWPVHARLGCSFWHVPQDQAADAPVDFGPSPLDTMSWTLLEQTAVLMGLGVIREDQPGRAQLVLEFTEIVNDPVTHNSAVEREDAQHTLVNSKPLAGSHLLVLAGRRETRSLVKESVRHMGLMVDFVQSINECREFCQGGLPHAIAYESAIGGERFEKLRAELLADMPTLVFIEVSEEGRGYEVRQVGDRHFASVNREALVEALPAALMFELSRPR